MQKDELLGKRVNITFPHYCRITRILKEDSCGLYVKFQKQKCYIRPETNCLGEVIKDYYVGIHPKLARMLNNE